MISSTADRNWSIPWRHRLDSEFQASACARSALPMLGLVALLELPRVLLVLRLDGRHASGVLLVGLPEAGIAARLDVGQQARILLLGPVRVAIAARLDLGHALLVFLLGQSEVALVARLDLGGLARRGGLRPLLALPAGLFGLRQLLAEGLVQCPDLGLGAVPAGRPGRPGRCTTTATVQTTGPTTAPSMT